VEILNNLDHIERTIMIEQIFINDLLLFCWRNLRNNCLFFLGFLIKLGRFFILFFVRILVLFSFLGAFLPLVFLSSFCLSFHLLLFFTPWFSTLALSLIFFALILFDLKFIFRGKKFVVNAFNVLGKLIF